MSVQKKSLISNRTSVKKALVAKSAGRVADPTKIASAGKHTLTKPTLNKPTLSRPTLSRPTLSRPTLSRPTF